ncbi:MAG: hypothetical protein AB7E51_06665 [Pseudodesulfovibrio sp.]|uniref:hypothetical protein n=1 Tax=Pseudodesulfovibrio sp. TaxID=2035812 RepID=UPI003D0B958D
MPDKSADLAPDRCRCDDQACMSWQSDCARAEIWTDDTPYVWLPLCTRPQGARSCSRRIDPHTMEEGA